ncbi:hypothetical protein LINPERPRIM_LOCUS36172 [Linum perenne]
MPTRLRSIPLPRSAFFRRTIRPPTPRRRRSPDSDPRRTPSTSSLSYLLLPPSSSGSSPIQVVQDLKLEKSTRISFSSRLKILNQLGSATAFNQNVCRIQHSYLYM